MGIHHRKGAAGVLAYEDRYLKNRERERVLGIGGSEDGGGVGGRGGGGSCMSRSILAASHPTRSVLKVTAHIHRTINNRLDWSRHCTGLAVYTLGIIF